MIRCRSFQKNFGKPKNLSAHVPIPKKKFRLRRNFSRHMPTCRSHFYALFSRSLCEGFRERVFIKSEEDFGF